MLRPVRSIAQLAAVAATLLMAVPALAADHAVSLVGTSFTPNSLNIAVGDKVIWTVEGGGHTCTSGSGCVADGVWDSGFLGPGQSFERVFNAEGTFPYYCIPHCGCCVMVGVVVVEAPAECMLNCPAGDGGPIGGVGPSNKSPDLNGDGLVGLQDVALFAAGFMPSYDVCIDYDCDGAAGLVDLSIFAMHYLHDGVPGVCQ